MASVRLDSKNVGDTIKIKENSTAVDFIVVHKGAPSTAYYGMDGGVIVLRKDIHSNGVYDSSNNDYANSDVHSWCNNTYLNTIQEDVRSQIMTVRIPYRRGTSGSSVSTGANGLQCKVFLLSTKEVDSTESYSPNEGAVFSYFSGGGNSKRIANLNGSPNYWWLRSPNTYSDRDYARVVTSSGYVDFFYLNGVRGSYGRLISPNMDVDIEDVWGVRSNGAIIYVSNVYDHSYGQSYIIKVRFTTRIISVLYMKGAIKYEMY